MLKGLAVAGLQSGAIALVILVIVVAISAQIISGVGDTTDANTVERNATDEGLAAMDEFSNWFTIIVLVIIAVVIIGLLLRGFGGITQGA